MKISINLGISGGEKVRTSKRLGIQLVVVFLHSVLRRFVCDPLRLRVRVREPVELAHRILFRFFRHVRIGERSAQACSDACWVLGGHGAVVEESLKWKREEGVCCVEEG